MASVFADNIKEKNKQIVTQASTEEIERLLQKIREELKYAKVSGVRFTQQESNFYYDLIGMMMQELAKRGMIKHTQKMFKGGKKRKKRKIYRPQELLDMMRFELAYDLTRRKK